MSAWQSMLSSWKGECFLSGAQQCIQADTGRHVLAASDRVLCCCSYYNGLGHGNLTHQTFIEEGKMVDPNKKEEEKAEEDNEEEPKDDGHAAEQQEQGGSRQGGKASEQNEKNDDAEEGSSRKGAPAEDRETKPKDDQDAEEGDAEGRKQVARVL